MIRRRQFMTLLGGAAAAWPLAAQAQQFGRIAVLDGRNEGDLEVKAELAGFRQGLESLGWSEGHNVRIDYRFAAGRIDQIPVLAKELVALQPDVILSQGTAITAALQRQSRSIPIVFVLVSDPIGSGYIATLARPGSNLTGFLMYEASITGKWLAMLKEIAPSIARVALLVGPTTAYQYFMRAAASVAPSLAMELVPSLVENTANIERAIESLSREPNGGLVLPPDNTTLLHRDLIIALAAQHRLPAAFGFSSFVKAGGLMSYGADPIDMYRRAASYIDRILRGEKPADLPVQAPVKYETALNLKTAKALGLTVPPGLLAIADEVIE
jgi:putative ABC transport system substrate-binding protein